jgi:elongation factor G
MEEGSLIGYPIIGVRVIINDGTTHPVDSSDVAFQQAAVGCFRQAYPKANPVILEPIMKVTLEGPTEYQGNMFGTINQRRGVILSSSEDGNFSVVEAEVPLSEMFGFSTVLRSLTQGKAEFSMEFLKYGKVPKNVADELIREHQQEKSTQHN